MKHIEMRQDPDNPALVVFYVDGVQVENMRCMPGVRNSQHQIEAVAKVVMNKHKEVEREDSAGDQEDVHTEDQRQPGTAGAGSDRGDLPTTKRSRTKAPKKDASND